jgi:hypothetical protein
MKAHKPTKGKAAYIARKHAKAARKISRNTGKKVHP